LKAKVTLARSDQAIASGEATAATGENADACAHACGDGLHQAQAAAEDEESSAMTANGAIAANAEGGPAIIRTHNTSTWRPANPRSSSLARVTTSPEMQARIGRACNTASGAVFANVSRVW
jgi:hypothetical protein